MLVRILGSAAGGGFPQWNCGCRNCHGLRTGTIQAIPRMQESACLTANSTDYVLINASPDVRAQIESYRSLHPRATRHSPIEAVILTSGDLDHCLGLFSLRESHPLVVYATPSVWQGLTEGNSLYRTLERFPGQVTWRKLTLDSDEPLLSSSGKPLGLWMRVVAVPGKVPLHLEGRVSPQDDQNIGLLLREDGCRSGFAYLPSAACVTPAMLGLMKEADVLVFDGTFWSNDELARHGISYRSAEEMAHLPVSGKGGSLSLLSDLVPLARRIFTHVNNTNPILREDSPERSMITSVGWEVAYDEMELKL